MPAIQRLSAFLGIVFFLGCASVASASDEQNAKLSQSVSSLENVALPALIVSQDYWTASKVYLQVAIARSSLNETQAACSALSQSVAFYRAALKKDELSPVYFGDRLSDGRDDAVDLKEVRAKFGCESIQAASF